MKQRLCQDCGELKPLAQFPHSKRKLATGEIRYYPLTRCDPCHARYMRRYRARQKALRNPTASARRYTREERLARSAQASRRYQAARRREQLLLGGRINSGPFREWLLNERSNPIELAGEKGDLSSWLYDIKRGKIKTLDPFMVDDFLVKRGLHLHLLYGAD